ncbi:MAG TPA: TIM barrel protein [Patescibacteria group bacterium]|jgi:hydroxypyruvate isomerase|nr:TIM barrel protein [Patescibacteria group bacterium]
MTAAPMFPLAVTSEMLFRDLPYLDRVRRINDLGFQVEMWDWTARDLDAVAAIGATWSTMTGYVHGDLYDAGGGRELVRTARLAVDAARKIDCPRLVVHGAELDSSRNGLPFRPQPVVTGQMWLNAYRTLLELADLGEANGVVFCLENLNASVDHPGVPFGRVEDAITLVGTLDRPGVRLMLDLYHAQIGEGNLVELIRRAGPLIGEVQVADVPGRMEPGTGEINWRAIADALQAIGYSGVVGLEAFASGDDVAACEAFRAAFSR